jgi:hypothetical protein
VADFMDLSRRAPWQRPWQRPTLWGVLIRRPRGSARRALMACAGWAVTRPSRPLAPLALPTTRNLRRSLSLNSNSLGRPGPLRPSPPGSRRPLRTAAQRAVDKQRAGGSGPETRCMQQASRAAQAPPGAAHGALEAARGMAGSTGDGGRAPARACWSARSSQHAREACRPAQASPLKPSQHAREACRPAQAAPLKPSQHAREAWRPVQPGAPSCRVARR